MDDYDLSCYKIYEKKIICRWSGEVPLIGQSGFIKKLAVVHPDKDVYGK